MIPALILLVLGGLGASVAWGQDADGDRVADDLDNCLLVVNADQADADGNGLGDVCECGDFTLDGVVNTTDARLIQRCAVAEIDCAGLCDVTEDGICNTTDARLIQRAAVGQLTKQNFHCRVRPAEPDVDNDGDGLTELEGDCDDADHAVVPGAVVVAGEPPVPTACWSFRAPVDPPVRETDGCSGPLGGVSNNPTDDLVGEGSCPDAAFGSGDLLAPRACEVHDLCYLTCGIDREACDAQLRINLRAICNALPPEQVDACRETCLALADQYADAAEQADGLSYLVGQGRACTCCSDPDGPVCGDTVCEGSEECHTCPADCGGCAVLANCNLDEECTDSQECSFAGRCKEPRCGDGRCGLLEDCSDCPEDCCTDGDGDCTRFEACTCRPDDFDCSEAPGDCGRCGLGHFCDADDECESGLCSGALDENGGICRNDGCGDDVCSLIERCGDDNNAFVGECRSDCDLCQEGDFCGPGGSGRDGQREANADCAEGLACIRDTFTTPGRCGALLEPGKLCISDFDCALHNCTLGVCEIDCGDDFCTAGAETCFASGPRGCQADCGKCRIGDFCREDADCASDICDVGACGGANTKPNGSLCTDSRVCISGRCLAGICTPSCGNDQCEEPAEACGVSLNGCTDDCGLCPNGSVCVVDGDCLTGICNNAFQCAACKDNGQGCLTDDVCCTGICNNAFQCASCRANGESCLTGNVCCSGICNSLFQCATCKSVSQVCSSDGECCSGNCNVLGVCGL